MKIVQGFVTKGSFINNSAGAISDFFELSPFALTYSRLQGEYQNIDYPGDVLHTFKSVDLDTNVSFELSSTMVKEVLSVIATVLTYSLQYNSPFNRLDYTNFITAEHTGKIINVELGQFYPGTKNTLPEWITWESLTNPETKVKIWLRNEAFEGQYSDYEVVVIPPIDQLDDFFGSYAAEAKTVSSITISQVMDRVMTYRNDLPETYLRVFEFEYVNKNNTTQRTKVYWSVLIYGKNGDNVDSIKDAIVDYVLKHSSKTLSEWDVIFPELFKRTEFIFLPRWDKIAIPNLTELAALYSSILNPVECVSKAISFWSDINTSWVENNLSILPFDYKSINVIALNGQTNRTEYADLKTIFSDYLPMGTMTSDFNRMSLNTRNWVLKMVELLKVAESADENTNIENPLRRITRNGKIYISVMHNDINFLVATRHSVV